MMEKFRLLVVSHVYPFPGAAGQQRRVHYKLEAFRKHFHITFLTVADATQLAQVKAQLSTYCDEAIVLPARYTQNQLHRVFHNAVSVAYRAFTGLKFSNYRIGKVEFSPARIAQVPNMDRFDCALYEYWHATDSVSVFQTMNIPCVLDMHDILWKSYEQHLMIVRRLPNLWKQWALAQYRQREHQAWERFDALIAINDNEYKHVQTLFPQKPTFCAPMGIDTNRWVYSWEPAMPARVAYYGALSSSVRQQEAMRSYRHIMPRIWEQHPNTEFWIIGSNPPDFIRALPSRDSRVHVSGFIEDVQSLLKTATVVICPFEGQFGFRSRLIEVMALGVPVVATHDAVHGMKLDADHGLFLGNEDEALARYCARLLRESDWAKQHSQLARQQVEEKYSFDATYGKLARDLSVFVDQHG